MTFAPRLRLLSVRRLSVFAVHVALLSTNAPTIYDCYESTRVPTSCPPFEYNVLRATTLYYTIGAGARAHSSRGGAWIVGGAERGSSEGRSVGCQRN